MRFVDNLRKAEEKSVMTIRRGVERAREEWADVERRLRQRMRIYPQKKHAEQKEQSTMAAAAQGEAQTPEREGGPSERGTERKPIVSVHGQDLREN